MLSRHLEVSLRLAMTLARQNRMSTSLLSIYYWRY